MEKIVTKVIVVPDPSVPGWRAAYLGYLTLKSFVA
jgi:hypothetical protein